MKEINKEEVGIKLDREKFNTETINNNNNNNLYLYRIKTWSAC